MNLETEVLKTNEFLRRRKLRLQQVREQSKDIAKKIRKRAEVEKLRQVVDIDVKKQQEYLEKQEKLVKHLEVLYVRGLENVGAGHQSATDLANQEEVVKTDLSKARGKEAAAELRRIRQQKLDEQKKLLDRKLQAREAANELSREKSTLTSKLTGKPTKAPEDSQKPVETTESKEVGQSNDVPVVKTSDMATQWDVDTMPNEWDPTVPALSLPKDDNSIPECDPMADLENKSDKSKRLDLFAVSKEMPSSLRGQHGERNPVTNRPSLTLVSEYLQSRKLRLRETAVNVSKPAEDIHCLRQTIQRTRMSKPDEVTGKTRAQVDKTSKDTLNRKPSVTIYNHSTRDVRDMPCGDGNIVVRDFQTEEDAYSQAFREATTDNEKENEHQKKIHEMRNRVAVTKQNVEKEYKETINFLNNLPKSSGNVIKTAYMDDYRQQQQKEQKQRKMQNEFRRIERECIRDNNSLHDSRSKSKSPSKSNNRDLENRDFQYSWMPVPEGDGNLAVHTIPNNTKGKNSVTFSQVDSYHEYRSRHKHTPPTKDNSQNNKRKTVVIDKSSSDSTDNESDTSSVENLRLEKKRHNPPKNDLADLSDAERIIIYKILDSKKDKKCKKQTKLLTDIAKSLSHIQKTNEIDKSRSRSGKTMDTHSDNTVSLEQINEGVYKVVDEQGENLNSFNLVEEQPGPSKASTEAVKLKHCHCKTKENIPNSTVLQWQSGEDIPRAGPCKCRNTSEEKTKPSGNQNISTGNSASSFKTATNDRMTNARSEEGFIKLLDEAGHEAGKFFIGASGLLSDNAYEVVIQLRKKDDSKKETETENKQHSQQSVGTSATNVGANAKLDQEVITQHRSDDDKQHDKVAFGEPNTILTATDVTEKSVEPTPLINYSGQSKQTFDNKNMNTEAKESKYDNVTSNGSSANISLKRSDNKLNMVDKSVYTSFSINDQVGKSESVSRPATTTFTQTSSPRPVYYHMSSSTSTAYMSPPEKILPKSIRRARPQSATIKRSSYEHEFCETYSGCICHRCDGKSQGTGEVKETERQALTPPNTPLSNRSIKQKHDCDNKASKICKSKWCKCATRDKLKDTCKNNLKNKTILTNIYKRPISKLNSRCSANASSKPPTKITKNRQDIRSSTNMNPLVKKYVDKLLILSKESLKALEVADQNCSSITTPGSSIINVQHNIDERKTSLLSKISLEQIKNALLKEIKENVETKNTSSGNSVSRIGSKPRVSRKKSVHKVKSFNVSKNLVKKPKLPDPKQKPKRLSWTSTDETVKTLRVPSPRRVPSKPRSKSSPTPRLPSYDNSESSTKNTTTTETNPNKLTNKPRCTSPKFQANNKPNNSVKTSTDSEEIKLSRFSKDYRKPTSMSTQTNENIDDINFMKLAEDKLNNMEKIADLTEKCTKRLSNLAKVLDEVRKNKSLAYGQISTSDSTESQSVNKSDKIVDTSPVEVEMDPVSQPIQKKLPKSEAEYFSIFTDIPKSTSFKIPELKSTPTPNDSVRSGSVGDSKTTSLSDHSKRLKPPPALTRMNLKHGDKVIPHELSTVIEVDSPMSIKNRPVTSRNNTKEGNNTNPKHKNVIHNEVAPLKDPIFNPDILLNNIETIKRSTRNSSVHTNDDSKFQMIDLKQFNEIMLEPFISIQEYAKKFNVEPPDEGSNLEDLQRDEPITDEFSSLHSDGSLPDVIGELLKRNIITEPFKFDTVSNINSTTLSSESNLSSLALSKIRKEKKKPSVTFQNKENIGESSDVLSISSNPDLENAFKKLGLGWASSTLKKTKERLALSSSSNTSSSSTSQYILKHFSQDIPVIVTDSVSSVLNQSQRGNQSRSVGSSKHVQQKILMNAMTVKEFLTNELANKITFNNKSVMNDTEEEFVSLFETKMPEEIKQASETQREEISVDSTRSGANRARTSTPVQMYKSTTYHSSSSSNISNGLFSNADDISSVKMTSNSNKNHSTSEKDDLTIPNFSLRMKKASDCSKSD